MSTPGPARTSNRRSSPRRGGKRHCRVVCRKGVLGIGPNLAVRLLDVSDNGVRLILQSPLEARTGVEVTFQIPGAMPDVARTGEIVWGVATAEDEFCVGVRFEKRLDYATFARLSTLSQL